MVDKQSFPSSLFRRKKYEPDQLGQTKLSRVLGVYDLVSLGVSCTMGASMFIMYQSVISLYSGPSMIFSYLIAGAATMFAALCYAEIGSRVPRAGSAYVYTYVTVGEFVAFMLGWDLILEYLIGTASIARGLSLYIDGLTGFQIREYFLKHLSINVHGLSSYPDFFALSFIILITVVMIISVKGSTILNQIFTIPNLVFTLFIIILGATKINPSNWNLQVNPNTTWIDPIDKSTLSCTSHPERCGVGGLAPFGIYGILKGASKCFYSYIGFDCIASTGEEVNNAKRTLPISIIITFIIVSALFFSSSMVFVLMMPYYMFDPSSTIVQPFAYAGMDWAIYPIAIAAITAMTGCLFSIYPVPRIMLAMATDGLLFKIFTYVPKITRTPIAATLFGGAVTGFLTVLFDMEQLVDMLSIGTLAAYTVVSICTVVLRFRPNDDTDIDDDDFSDSEKIFEPRNYWLTSFLLGESDEPVIERFLKPSPKCTNSSSRISNFIIFLIDIVIFSAILNFAPIGVTSLVFVGIFVVVMVIGMILLSLQPENTEISTFRLPFITVFPFLGITLFAILMFSLNWATWVRFISWQIIGLSIYFSYGYWNSSLR